MIAVEANSSKLPIGIYEKDKTGNPGPLNLVHNQYRSESPNIPQAAWFNGHGERLGMGDISGRDIKRIMEAIPRGELFVVLSASSGLHNLQESPRPKIPGIDYLADNFLAVVWRGSYYAPDTLIVKSTAESKATRDQAISMLLFSDPEKVSGDIEEI